MAKFQKGKPSPNPLGRPKMTVTASQLRWAIIEELPEIIGKLVVQAKSGDVAAAKLLLDRALPALRPQTEMVQFIPASNDNLSAFGQTVIDSLSRAEITPETANQMLRALASQAKLLESTDLLNRIEALEDAQP